MKDTKPKGTLIIIGGHEDRTKNGKRAILQEVSKRVNKTKGKLLLLTIATHEPEGVAGDYVKVFNDIGITKIDVLDIRAREEARSPEKLKLLENTSAVFITGGDQLRITSVLGDTPIYSWLEEFYKKGGLVAGTSAGAAVMPETMLISGPNDESNRLSTLGMAPGLGIIENVVIDSHFAERGRMGRLLGAVSQNPRNLGIGIDENTAIIVTRGTSFQVIGEGAVYVVDGSTVSYSSVSEKSPEGIISLFDVRMHVLGDGDCFDLDKREPILSAELRE